MGDCKLKDFWPTVKPFLKNKGSQVHKDTILFEDNKLINDQQEVCGISNHFFVNVAKNIGQNTIPVNENHLSILKIKDTLTEPSSFDFKPIKEEFISKQINKSNLKKATGYDGNSTKIVKLAQTTVIKPITYMINLTIKKSQFPDDAKKAVVAPLHKKNSCLDKENFLPVSILPILAKLYKKH